MEANKRYYWIDLLRFIAALLVVMAHYRGAFFVEYGLLPDAQKTHFTQVFFFLTRLGEEPVLIFFVLSGFLVGGRSLRKILNDEVDAKIYFLDRFVRILLPLFASSLLVVIIDLTVGDPIPFGDIFGSLLSLQGIITNSNHNAPLWSLSYEVWFYVLIGCIMVISRNKGKNALLAFLILTVSIYIFVQLKTIYLLILLIGSFAFLLPRENIKFKPLKIFILCFLLIAAIILVQLTLSTRSVEVSGFVSRDIASIFLAFITSLLVSTIIVTRPTSRIGNSLDKLSSKFSDFSYTLYLTHYPLMKLLTYFGFPKSVALSPSSISYYLLSILISLLSAYLIYLVSEKQTSRVKAWIKIKLNLGPDSTSTTI